MVNVKELKEMVNLMNENNLVELEIEKEGMRVRLKKTTQENQGYNGPIVFEKERLSQQVPRVALPEIAGCFSRTHAIGPKINPINKTKTTRKICSPNLMAAYPSPSTKLNPHDPTRCKP